MQDHELYRRILGIKTLSTGQTETRLYNSLLQLTRDTVPGLMDMEYRYTAGQNNGRIAQSKDWIGRPLGAEEIAYTCDSLQRLATAATTGPEWGEAYSYDGFGNLTGKAATKGQPPSVYIAINPATNQPANGNYDANGNAPIGTWDIENRLVQQVLNGSTIQWVYDPFGQRVAKYEVVQNPSGGSYPVWTFYQYDVNGRRLAEERCPYGSGDYCTVTTLNTYFGGKLIGVVDASGHTLTATDRLGTMRAVNTNGTWAMPTYYPYGEPRTTGGIDGKEQFGTYVRDSTAAQQDYADQRYYSNGLGSFYSPDPGGAATAKARTPLSWNRYSYSYGDPVNLRDLHGLLAAAPKENCGPTWIWDASLNGPCEDDGEGDDSGEMVGGGPIAAPEPPKPDCNALTSAVGFQGLNYTKALEIWDDGSLWADPNGATIAALAAVTWQGETSFSLHPVNNPNVNAQGKVWSVDYGPFQINPHFHSSATGQVIGTNGAGQTFNGDPDANISYGIGILRDLYSQYGTAAAGRYVGSRSNPNAQNRQATFNAWGNTLTTLFSIEECFPHI